MVLQRRTQPFDRDHNHQHRRSHGVDVKDGNAKKYITGEEPVKEAVVHYKSMGVSELSPGLPYERRRLSTEYGTGPANSTGTLIFFFQFWLAFENLGALYALVLFI
jgi:hypothetical protein